MVYASSLTMTQVCWSRCSIKVSIMQLIFLLLLVVLLLLLVVLLLVVVFHRGNDTGLLRQGEQSGCQSGSGCQAGCSIKVSIMLLIFLFLHLLLVVLLLILLLLLLVLIGCWGKVLDQGVNYVAYRQPLVTTFSGPQAPVISDQTCKNVQKFCFFKVYRLLIFVIWHYPCFLLVINRANVDSYWLLKRHRKSKN